MTQPTKREQLAAMRLDDFKARSQARLADTFDASTRAHARARKPNYRPAEVQRIIALLWAVALGAIAMSVVAAGLLLSTRKGGGR
jgi:hypothetical protein